MISYQDQLNETRKRDKKDAFIALIIFTISGVLIYGSIFLFDNQINKNIDSRINLICQTSIKK